jgi:hypothetical protein
MQTRTTTWMTSAILGMGALACDKGRSIDTASPSAPSQVTNTNAKLEKSPDPLATVANRDQLVADPSATPIDPPRSAQLVTGFATMVRNGPRGSLIESVESTADVTEVQRDGHYFLVTYPDPNGSNKRYAGWVYRDALVGEGAALSESAGGIAGERSERAKLSCPRGQSHLRTTQDFCGKTCSDDKGCDASKGQICDGLAFAVNERTSDLTDSRYCISDSSPQANAAHGPDHASNPVADPPRERSDKNATP